MTCIIQPITIEIEDFSNNNWPLRKEKKV